MSTLESGIDAVATKTGFSGVVRVDDLDRGIVVAQAYGLAHRGYETPNGVGTQFALASGTKGLTALVVVGLIEDGLLELTTPARDVLGSDLPLIEDAVTVEHLLSHRSGIGDYLDEETGFDLSDYLMPVPVHELVTTEDYLAALGGQPTKFAAGERFSYCNGGYVVLALIAERVAGEPFHDLVRGRVCEPAGMADTAFLRSDEPSPGVAVGYVQAEGLQTNVFHLPVRGNGDGGIYSTVADLSSLWRAFFAGEIVSTAWVGEMTRPRSVAASGSMNNGLGFWLHPSSGALELHGCDTGVSVRTVHDPARGLTHTVISNTAAGAWPVSDYLDEQLGL